MFGTRFVPALRSARVSSTRLTSLRHPTRPYLHSLAPLLHLTSHLSSPQAFSTTRPALADMAKATFIGRVGADPTFREVGHLP